MYREQRTLNLVLGFAPGTLDRTFFIRAAAQNNENTSDMYLKTEGSLDNLSGSPHTLRPFSV